MNRSIGNVDVKKDGKVDLVERKTIEEVLVIVYTMRELLDRIIEN